MAKITITLEDKPEDAKTPIVMVMQADPPIPDDPKARLTPAQMVGVILTQAAMEQFSPTQGIGNS